MKLPRLTRSGLLLAVLVPAVAFGAQTAANTYNTQGARDRQRGDFQAAIADFTKAIELKPDYAVAYSNRAGAKRALKDFDGAIADCTKAIELQPDYAVAYNNRGGAKLAKGDIDGAAADFAKAVDLDPRHNIGAVNLATTLKLKKRFPHGVNNPSDEAIFARQAEEIASGIQHMSDQAPEGR
jgi:tetratricopeptide (TPR) repeat protein